MAEDKPHPGVEGYVPLRVRVEKGLEELDRIRAECREPNWDSYNAEPVKAEAVIMAARLLDLPGGPLYGKHPVPTTSGGIQFEWEDDISGGGYCVTVEFVGNSKEDRGG